jgi:large subunit ribosomal protein L18e
LIDKLKKKSIELKVAIWKAAAEKLEKPRRRKVEVSLADIQRNANEGDTILVPGIVLGNGSLSKCVRIAALRFSTSVLKKLKETGSEALSIEQLLEENPKGKNVKIIV